MSRSNFNSYIENNILKISFETVYSRAEFYSKKARIIQELYDLKNDEVLFIEQYLFSIEQLALKRKIQLSYKEAMLKTGYKSKSKIHGILSRLLDKKLLTKEKGKRGIYAVDKILYENIEEIQIETSIRTQSSFYEKQIKIGSIIKEPKKKELKIITLI